MTIDTRRSAFARAMSSTTRRVAIGAPSRVSRGRKGVFEVLEVTPQVRRGIGPKADAIDLERVARDAGMVTMTEDGIEKCRAGLTTVDEVFRVTASL
jgi:type II secretory ATPase GspE/PulE/Tfp pilus assembly ATPase PilB-like protein